MSLQMQLRRGVIALIIGLALCGLALSRASVGDAADVQGVGLVTRAADTDRHKCGSHLRIDITPEIRLSVSCDGACAPLNRVLQALDVPTIVQSRCIVRSA